MNFKRAQIVASEADIIVKSAMYLIPEPNQKFRIVVVDDAGNKRYLSGSGLDGKSAYEVAVQNGYIGTETEWLNSLKGQPGPQGDSAYQVAVNNGYEGSQVQWLQYLEGNTGPQGPPGANGLTPTIAVGSVTSLPTNQTPTITNTGTSSGAVFNFGIPKGETGLQGAQGIQGTQGAAGPKGDTGAIGPQGVKGDSGQNSTVSSGTVTTLPSNQPASVTNSGTPNNAVFNFSIPQGEKGITGISGSNAYSFRFKSKINNYSELPSSNNIINDAYYNIQDSLWYIYNGISFPASGQGIAVGVLDMATDFDATNTTKAQSGRNIARRYDTALKDFLVQTLVDLSNNIGDKNIYFNNLTLAASNDPNSTSLFKVPIPINATNIRLRFMIPRTSSANVNAVSCITFEKQDGSLVKYQGWEVVSQNPLTTFDQNINIEGLSYKSITVTWVYYNGGMPVEPLFFKIETNGLSIKNYTDGNFKSNNSRITIEGQSNAVGYANINDLLLNYNSIAWHKALSRVFMWNPTTNQYENLRIETNSFGIGTSIGQDPIPNSQTSNDYFGVEIPIALIWLETHKTGNLYINKDTGNGQPISYFQKGTSYYSRKADRKSKADKWLFDRGIQVSEDGFVWIQGESDINNTNYLANLNKLVSDRIDDGFLKNYTKIIITQINTGNSGYSSNVSDSKSQYVASNNKASLVAYPSQTLSDNLHLTTDSIMTLGFNAASKIFITDLYIYSYLTLNSNLITIN